MPDGLTLVLNVGSSSLKAAIFGPNGRGSARQGVPGRAADRTQGGAPGEELTCLWRSETRLSPGQEALSSWLEPALEAWWSQLARAGHRLVHGGERFQAPTRIDEGVLIELGALNRLAPLHNPPALAALHWLQRRRPTLPQWACFDTAFHATLPAAACTYALPATWRADGRRRYGFHGLSHQHLAEAGAAHWRQLGRSGQPRLISCHLGAGCSLAAVREGRSIDTTMGFTPLEGLVMASRSGSVDPGLLLDLLRGGVSLEQLEQGLNRTSGLAGLSGLSGDWLELKGAARRGHEGAQLALAVFRHRLLAGIGAMAASLGGVDLIGLTGGIGARDQELLADLQQSLDWLRPLVWLQVDADEESVVAHLIGDANEPSSS